MRGSSVASRARASIRTSEHAIAPGQPAAVPFGPYLLLKRVAVGGMAELFLAKDTRTDRMVVLKRILPHLAEEEEFVRMFLDEARIAASLHHPNIVEMIELGRRDGSTFIAMEWVDGIDLRRVLYKEQERSGVVPPGVAAWIVARLCEGLAHAHDRADADGAPLGIVHRDISPQNVMVTYRGEVKLVDFGIAKVTAWMDRSKPGIIKGKFLYLAPEQLAQEKLDKRVDLFASGTLMYELTTRKSPFYRATSEEVIYAVRMEEAEPPTSARPGFPVMLSNIIMKCLMKERTKRYPSALDLRDALEDFMRIDAPTTRGDVVRYVASLFGSDEERTSLFLPPNARGPDDEPSAERPPPPVPTPAPEAPAVMFRRFEADPEPTAPMDKSPRLDVDPAATPLAPVTRSEASIELSDPTTTPRIPARDYVATANIADVARELERALEATRPPPLPRRAPPPVIEPTNALEPPPVPKPHAPQPRSPSPKSPAPQPPPRPVFKAPARPQRSAPKVEARRPLTRTLASPDVPPDPDDFISTDHLDTTFADQSRTNRDGELRGRRVLLGIIGASVLLLALLLTLILWPAPGRRDAVINAPPPQEPPSQRRVRVTLKAPRGTLISIGGASLPGTSFEQAPGPVTIEWKCRKKKKVVAQKRTFEVPDLDAVSLELTCP